MDLDLSVRMFWFLEHRGLMSIASYLVQSKKRSNDLKYNERSYGTMCQTIREYMATFPGEKHNHAPSSAYPSTV